MSLPGMVQLGSSLWTLPLAEPQDPLKCVAFQTQRHQLLVVEPHQQRSLKLRALHRTFRHSSLARLRQKPHHPTGAMRNVGRGDVDTAYWEVRRPGSMSRAWILKLPTPTTFQALPCAAVMMRFNRKAATFLQLQPKGGDVDSHHEKKPG